jgi:uncharacterized protein DUF4863
MPVILEVLRPLLEAAQGLDLSDPSAARATLERRFDPHAPAAHGLAEELRSRLERGELCPQGAPPVRWGRVSKAAPETLGFSIDAVHMSAAGPRHRHPAGEINFCVPLSGTPRFETCGGGWVVMPPGSIHVPAVEGGEMLILYFLPGGAMEFLRDPATDRP